YTESLDGLIDEELLYQAAAESTAPPSVATLSSLVEEVVAELEREFGGSAALADALRRQGDSLAAFKQRLQKKQERDYRIHRAISARVALTDDEVTSFEAALRREGLPVERYLLAHILIRCEDGATSDAEAKAEERAYEALGLLSKGKSFDDVAQMMSDDDFSARIGGYLGFVDQGSFAPPLEAAIRSLKVGEVSRPVRGPAGYHVFKLLDRQSARDKLYRQKFDAERTRWLSDLRSRAYIHRLPNPYE
ncbi:MAG: peptidylprolyl isomerase, partial [bacterium]